MALAIQFLVFTFDEMKRDSRNSGGGNVCTEIENKHRKLFNEVDPNSRKHAVRLRA